MRLVPIERDPAAATFDRMVEDFEWEIPEYFNIATHICDRHANGTEQVALYYEHEDGRESQWSFDAIARHANQLANWMVECRVGEGDRIAIVLSQCPEAAIAHVAVLKLGGISVPLSVLFGEDALIYRLQDSGAKVVIANREHANRLAQRIDALPDLEQILVCDSNDNKNRQTAFYPALKRQPVEFVTVPTKASNPAFLIYTSGTTGQPKGALIAHRCLIGNLPGFELSLDFYPSDADVFYTPADWAWTGGLMDGLLPCWYYGKPVVGYEFRKFSAARALRILEKYSVTTGFIPPTALKMIRAESRICDQYNINLRAIMSAGESVGEELLQWGRDTFGVEINEMYGQTEHNYVIGNCSSIMPSKAGSIGKAYPGHRAAIMGEDGQLVDVGVTGEIVVHKDDAVHFLGYWKNDAATRDKYSGAWFRTGDTGYMDSDGYFWFVGRTDDVISSAGYRIGPGEIENCLLEHKAVYQVAAIGVPDPDGIRGDIVKVFVVLREGFAASAELGEEIRIAVRDRLAAYEYPRAIAFVDSLPMTTTGKIRRNELRQREALSQKP